MLRYYQYTYQQILFPSKFSFNKYSIINGVFRCHIHYPYSFVFSFVGPYLLYFPYVPMMSVLLILRLLYQLINDKQVNWIKNEIGIMPHYSFPSTSRI